MFNSSRQVRKQILSHRVEEIPAEVPPTAAKKSWAPAFKKYGKEFALGMGATMALSYVFEKISGSSSKESSAAATASETATGSGVANPNPANPAYPSSSSPNPGYSTSPDPSYSTSPNPSYSTSPNPSYSTPTTQGYSTPANQGYSTSSNPSYSTPTDPNSQTQNGYQQRDVDHDLPVETLGEPHLESCFIRQHC